MIKRGAVVLCGGQSKRMGCDKATLPFGPDELMVQRVVRLLQGCVSPDGIVVVAADGQQLPEFSDDVHIVRDRESNRGPLEGLAVGMAAVADRADEVYATSCDVPLLVPELVTKLFGLLTRSYDIVVPRDDHYHHPLAAVYRPTVVNNIEALLKEGQRRPRSLFERCPTYEVSTADLRDVDPHLWTLWNLNTQEEYQRALEVAFHH